MDDIMPWVKKHVPAFQSFNIYILYNFPLILTLRRHMLVSGALKGLMQSSCSNGSITLPPNPLHTPNPGIKNTHMPKYTRSMNFQHFYCYFIDRCLSLKPWAVHIEPGLLIVHHRGVQRHHSMTASVHLMLSLTALSSIHVWYTASYLPACFYIPLLNSQKVRWRSKIFHASPAEVH